MKIRIWVLLGLLGLPLSALAFDCPNLMQQVDNILAKSPDLDEETIVDEDNQKTVKQLREEGEAAHRMGDHDKSVKLLERALELLANE